MSTLGRDESLAGAGQRPCLIKTYRPLDHTLAEKQDWKTYKPGMFINFFSTYGKIKKGSTCTVSKVLLDGIEVHHAGKEHFVSFRYAQRWQRVEERALECAQGELLQIKSNLVSTNGVLLANGERVTLLGNTQDALVLQKADGQTAHLSNKNAILDYGYAVTSYASQGKTVDKVILWDSGSVAASSLEQWYVSLSRGRKQACILTQNAQDLQERIVGSFGQKPAIETAWKPLNYQRIENFGLDTKNIQQTVQAVFEQKKAKVQSQEKIEAELEALKQKIVLIQKEQQEVCEEINARQQEEYLAACELYKEQFANYCNNRSRLKKSFRWIVGAKQIEEPTMPKMPQRISIKALEENWGIFVQKFPMAESIKGSFEEVRKLQKERSQLQELLPKKQTVAVTLGKRAVSLLVGKGRRI